MADENSKYNTRYRLDLAVTLHFKLPKDSEWSRLNQILGRYIYILQVATLLSKLEISLHNYV